MRIVVDTNVLVSACIGNGPASRLVELCLTGELTPVIGVTLFLEYLDVIEREPLFKAARLSLEERQLLLRAFVSRSQWQEVFYLWRPNLPDEADNHVFELAVAANSATIVNQRDFRQRELRFPDLRAVTPDVFLEERNS
ncbi:MULTISPECIES: putative toxin-antitoxin system toxin component, PIN family [unclassified Rhizobium]|jgi:putative PIN family toxin of toxin-antitoxin system|uniref:putative toxin-antitoxin system toxin component, PIN family n=1 Tax=unclassified Rhizobium TaxID=2613769 RepID=UPI000DDB7EA0|nr:putative toxin-antitoxin system toxin component, PIN family [Rhizobium sp. UBA1881]